MDSKINKEEVKMAKKDFITTRLGACLKFRHLRYMDIALAMGVSASTVFDWIDGAPPSIRQMRSIANYLLVGVTDIWPSVKEPVDWEYRHQLITDRLATLDYKSKEFSELARERAAVSVKIYITEHNSLLRAQAARRGSTAWDNNPLNEDIYGRMNPGNKSVLTSY